MVNELNGATAVAVVLSAPPLLHRYAARCPEPSRKKNLMMETQHEKDQDHRTHLAGRRDPGARRTGLKTATTRMADGRHRIEAPPGKRPSPRHRAGASICCLAAAPTISSPATGRRPPTVRSRTV